MTESQNELKPLLPCQLCGSTEVEYHERTHWTGMRSIVLAVDLTHHCAGHERPEWARLVITAKTREDCVRVWNTRATSPAGRQIEAIRAAMGYCKSDLDKSANHSDSYSALWGVYRAIESILKDG